MKKRKVDQKRLARDLGSEIRGHVSAEGGYFGALQLAETVRRHFRRPARGGRSRDPRWDAKRLLPVRTRTLRRLERLAKQVSELADHRVEPLQVAAILVERDLDRLGDEEIARAVLADVDTR
jgi:hypothetical protein